MLSSDEFDRKFDSGEEIEEFVDWSQKPVVIKMEEPTVRMTAKEMREKHPLTPERIKELELLSQNEPDISDPDNPELDDEFWEKAHRPELKSLKKVFV